MDCIHCGGDEPLICDDCKDRLTGKGRTDRKERDRMYLESGEYQTANPLVAFLYQLMRDEVTPGAVEKIMDGQRAGPYCLTNGWLARHAEDIAKRLAFSWEGECKNE